MAVGGGRVLHLGCGGDTRPGWVNLDTGVRTLFKADGTIVINHDLREGLPFEDGYFGAIYSSHFFEHLTTPEGLVLMRDCLRVLAPGGLFRAAMPDARLAIRAYLAKDEAFFAKATELVDSALPAPEVRSDIDFIDRDARAWNHKALYDPDKMIRMLGSVGFAGAREAEFDPAFDISHELRRFFSFYVVASKS